MQLLVLSLLEKEKRMGDMWAVPNGHGEDEISRSSSNKSCIVLKSF